MILLRSSKVPLPGADRAIIDIEKLRGYCLNPMHPRGRHKARVFLSALLLTQDDAQWLQGELRIAALFGNAVPGFADDYGARYLMDFHCEKEGRSATIRSSWIVRANEDFPRLISCYVL